MKTIEDDTGFIILILFLLFAIFYLCCCSDSVNFKGTSNVKASGTATVQVQGGATETINVVITVDLASQIYAICNNPVTYDTCSANVIAAFNQIAAALKSQISIPSQSDLTDDEYQKLIETIDNIIAENVA